MNKENGSGTGTDLPKKIVEPEHYRPDKEHASIGPSSLTYRQVCRGYNTPDSSGDNFFAERGAKLHAAMESEDVTGLSEFEQSQIDWVNSWEDRCNFKDDVVTGDAKEYNEIPLDIMNGFTFGTPDKVVVWYEGEALGRAILIDYKFGEHPVPPAEINLQGIAYAVGVFEKFWWVGEVTVYFFSPLIKHWTFHTFNREDYEMMCTNISTTVKLNEDCQQNFRISSEHFQAGQHCAWCDNLTKCPMLRETAHKLALAYPHDLKIPSIPDPSEITEPNDVNVGKTLAVVMAAWADKMNMRAKELANDGMDLKDWEIATRAGRRKVDNVIRLFELVNEDLPGTETRKGEFPKVSVGDFLDACDVSMTKLEATVKENVPRGHGKAATDLLSEYVNAEAIATRGAPAVYLKRKPKTT